MMSTPSSRRVSLVSLLAAGLVVLFTGAAARADALGDLANSMQAGTWAELTGMSGWQSGAILSPTDLGCMSTDYITQYADKAAWDPINKRVLFVGQTHGQCYGGRFVIYSAATNSWSQGPWLPGICQSGTDSNPCFSHAYGHNTVDPATGDFYYRQYYSLKFFRYRAGTWSTLPSPAAGSFQCCGSLEFFPDMHRLIFVDGDWGVWSFNPSDNTWSAVANTNAANAVSGLLNLPMSSTSTFAVYNPLEKIVLFGGGNSVYKMDAAGKITTLKSSPIGLGVTRSVTSVDPVSGKFIVLSGSSMYQYDAAADTWAKVPTTVPTTLYALDGVGDGLVHAPIRGYGVIMFMKYNFGNSKVYLYKHSAFTVLAPEAPADLSAK